MIIPTRARAILARILSRDNPALCVFSSLAGIITQVGLQGEFGDDHLNLFVTRGKGKGG